MKIHFLGFLLFAAIPRGMADPQPFAVTPFQLDVRSAAGPAARGPSLRLDASGAPVRVEYGQPIPAGNGQILGRRLDAPGPGYRALRDKYWWGVTERSLRR
jgi:hypothetical protein